MQNNDSYFITTAHVNTCRVTRLLQIVHQILPFYFQSQHGKCFDTCCQDKICFYAVHTEGILPSLTPTCCPPDTSKPRTSASKTVFLLKYANSPVQNYLFWSKNPQFKNNRHLLVRNEHRSKMMAYPPVYIAMSVCHCHNVSSLDRTLAVMTVLL